MQYNFSCNHVETVRRNSLVALAVRLGLANAASCPCLYLQSWFFEMLLVQVGNFIFMAFASLYIRLPFRAPEGRALC